MYLFEDDSVQTRQNNIIADLPAIRDAGIVIRFLPSPSNPEGFLTWFGMTVNPIFADYEPVPAKPFRGERLDLLTEPLAPR